MPSEIGWVDADRYGANSFCGDVEYDEHRDHCSYSATHKVRPEGWTTTPVGVERTGIVLIMAFIAASMTYIRDESWCISSRRFFVPLGSRTRREPIRGIGRNGDSINYNI